MPRFQRDVGHELLDGPAGPWLREAIAEAEEARDRDVAGLADLEHRLELAAETVDKRGNRIRRNVTGWRSRPGLPAARRWMRVSRCGPSRSGHGLSLVEPMG